MRLRGAIVAGVLLAGLWCAGDGIAGVHPLPATLPAVTASLATIDDSPEHQFQSAAQALQAGRDGEALDLLAELTRREPNFRLAQLLYGQLLALRSGVADALPLSDADEPRLRELRDEYRVRLDAERFAPPAGTLPAELIELAGSARSALVADLSRSRLYVFSNSGGQLHLVGDYYASLARNGYGKRNSGDLRTPVGIYHATSFTPGRALPDFYGAGAFPLNYPNAWDRARGRTGRGIWLHGVPSDTYARAPRASEGCLVLANDDLLTLKTLIAADDTPVIFSDHIDWRPAAESAALRDELAARIEAWRQAWAAHNLASYQDFYADDFRSDDGARLPQFADVRLPVIDLSQAIEVRLNTIDLFAYPGQDGLALARFEQRYGSTGVAAISRRDQYWEKQADARWKIVREELR